MRLISQMKEKSIITSRDDGKSKALVPLTYSKAFGILNGNDLTPLLMANSRMKSWKYLVRTLWSAYRELDSVIRNPR